MEIAMCGKGVKNESYNEESTELDLENFKSRLDDIIQSIEDPRVHDNQTYSLFSLLAIIFCAIVGGANSISAIHRYATSKKKWLMMWLNLKQGIPTYDTFWWLLVRLDPSQTENLFRQWTSTLSKKEVEDMIAIDGKRLKGASNKNQSESLLHMVSAWSSCRGLILRQLKTETKSNLRNTVAVSSDVRMSGLPPFDDSNRFDHNSNLLLEIPSRSLFKISFFTTLQ
jgi:DDE_Tnp_1-associated